MDRHKLMQLARGVVERADLPGGLGITVVVHAAEPTPGDWPMAIETTLPSRHYYRALFSEAIAASVVADGGSVESAGDIAAADYERVVGGKEPS